MNLLIFQSSNLFSPIREKISCQIFIPLLFLRNIKPRNRSQGCKRNGFSFWTSVFTTVDNIRLKQIHSFFQLCFPMWLNVFLLSFLSILCTAAIFFVSDVSTHLTLLSCSNLSISHTWKKKCWFFYILNWYAFDFQLSSQIKCLGSYSSFFFSPCFT